MRVRRGPGDGEQNAQLSSSVLGPAARRAPVVKGRGCGPEPVRSARRGPAGCR
ncbi:hypothetical protein APASM_3229 [Actinosynnema pretiosum subsp. pretiosum]|nr:hypothetical protein APASM_3229 [Actinosynnema pretiosum subsp. pretiosum]